MKTQSRFTLIIFIIISSFILLLLFRSEDNSRLVSTLEQETVIPPLDESKDTYSSASQSVLSSYNFSLSEVRSMDLPPLLRETSGLATTSDGNIFTHNDEDGIIFELEAEDGSVISTFDITVNGQRVQDDLEGIAVAEENMYVINSNGKIYEFIPAGNGEIANCKIYPTSLAVDWEIEGLAYDPSIRSLVIISKNPLTATVSGKVGVFFWSLEQRALMHDETIFIPIKQFADKIGQKKFQPSGIEYLPASGHYLLIAARQHTIAEITPRGEVLTVQKLSGKLHRQMEGITFITGKGLFISDEGGNKSGRLTLYPLK